MSTGLLEEEPELAEYERAAVSLHERLSALVLQHLIHRGQQLAQIGFSCPGHAFLHTIQAGPRVILAPMSRQHAPSYADRLPPLVPKIETDISHLGDEMADLLYPGQRPRPFRMGVSFEAFSGPEGTRAVELARRSAVYRETQEDDLLVHHAEFDSSEARLLRDLFDLVGQRPGTEVTVDRKKPPYARELWLPLFWIFVGGEAV